MITAPNSLSSRRTRSSLCDPSSWNQSSGCPVSVMARTVAATGVPPRHTMSDGSQAKIACSRACASRIIAKVVSL